MPNGHGGLPHYGTPVLLGIFWALMVWWQRASASIMPHLLLYLASVLFGWSLAFHLTMWDVMEYGGAYTSEDEMTRAKRRCLIAAAVLIPVSIFVAYLISSQL
jgi:hypothetical protein